MNANFYAVCQCPTTWFGTVPPPCPVHNPSPATVTWISAASDPRAADPLTVPEDEDFGAWAARQELEMYRRNPPRLTVDAGWLLVVAILAAVVGVIVGRVTA